MSRWAASTPRRWPDSAGAPDRDLEAKGLLRREVDPQDTRARRLRVTPTGTRLALRAIDVVERVDAEFFAPVPQQPTLIRSPQGTVAVIDR